MATAETAELVARLSLKDEFSGTLKRIEGNTKKSASIMRGALSSGLGRSVSRIAEKGVRVLFGQVTSGLDSLAELESATTSVDGAIKQMGLTGQVTSQEIAGWANDIERNIEAAFDDKEITQAATTLIRFGKVTTSNLKPALTVIADLATKTGSVESAATLLAKALADPEKAAGKLARTGIILTKSQQAQIKAMMEAGDVAGAQKVILDALTAATKDAAKAMNGPMVDAQLILRDVTEDAQRALATGFIPVLTEVRDILSTELAKKDTLDNIKKFGEGLAGGLRGLIQTARGLPWDLIGDSLSTAAAGGKALLDAFLGLPPWVQGAVASGWGLNKLTGGAVFKIGVEALSGGFGAVFDKFFARGATPANPLFVSDVLGGKGGLPPAAGGAAAGGGALAGLLGTAGILAGFVAIGESAAALPGAFTNFQAAMDGITNKDLPAARTAFQDFVDGMPKLNPFVPTAVLDMINRELAKVPAVDPNRPSAPVTPQDQREHNRIMQVSQGELLADVNAVRDKIEAGRISAKTSADAQIAALNDTRDKVEAGRIATVSAVGTVRDRIETAKIATVSAVDTSRASIEANRIATVTALDTTKSAIVTAVGLPRPMSPDERDEFAGLQEKNAAIRDKIEASRIATVSAVDASKTAIADKVQLARDSIEAARIAQVSAITTTAGTTQGSVNRARDAIEAARIAQVSATTTSAATIANRGSADAQAIVTAIRNKDFSVKVTVNSSGSPDDRDKPKVTVQTGGNVNRATANSSGGPDDRG